MEESIITQWPVVIGTLGGVAITGIVNLLRQHYNNRYQLTRLSRELVANTAVESYKANLGFVEILGKHTGREIEIEPITSYLLKLSLYARLIEGMKEKADDNEIRQVVSEMMRIGRIVAEARAAADKS